MVVGATTRSRFSSSSNAGGAALRIRRSGVGLADAKDDVDYPPEKYNHARSSRFAKRRLTNHLLSMSSSMRVGLVLVVTCLVMLSVLVRSNSHDDDDARTMSWETTQPVPLVSSDPSAAYDPLDCPENPPPGYPMEFPVLDVLKKWPVNDVTPRSQIYQGLCIFDFSKATTDEEREALRQQTFRYRRADLPYLIRGDPAVQKTATRWANPDYVHTLFKNGNYRVERSDTNQLMFWLVNPSVVTPKNWRRPTTHTRMSFPEWLNVANVTSPVDRRRHRRRAGPTAPHFYLRADACNPKKTDKECGGIHIPGHSGIPKYILETLPRNEPVITRTDHLYQEMPFFNPDKPGSDLYLIEPEKQKRIECRFGMEGNTAINHFDHEDNYIAVLGGHRRYLLSHPKNCLNMALIPQRHPSQRHSEVDWANPDLEKYPEFAELLVNEVVLGPGDVLFLPTFWFHHIVSLNYNYQCNTRTRVTHAYDKEIYDCGFQYS